MSKKKHHPTSRQFSVSEQLVNELLNYLADRPYKEVESLIGSLVQELNPPTPPPSQ